MGELFQPYGLVLKNNSAIQKFLEEAASSSNAKSSAILLSAKKHICSDEIPYIVLRDIWSQMEPSQRPKFSNLLAGVAFVLPRPKPREKSKELTERLKRLQEMTDRKAYDALVKDITLKEDRIFLFIQGSTWVWFTCYCNNVHWLFGWTYGIPSFIWEQTSNECCRRYFGFGVWYVA